MISKENYRQNNLSPKDLPLRDHEKKGLARIGNTSEEDPMFLCFHLPLLIIGLEWPRSFSLSSLKKTIPNLLIGRR